MGTVPSKGDRVRCTGPLDDGSLGINYDLIDVEGTVTWVNLLPLAPVDVDAAVMQIAVDWDNGSKLMLLRNDPYEVI